MALKETYSTAFADAVHFSWGMWLRKHSGYLFVAPMLFYTIVMMAYPILSNLQTSLHDVDVATFRSGDAPFIGLENYRELLNNPAFLKAALVSISFTSVSIFLQFSVGFALALFFNQKFPGN